MQLQCYPYIYCVHSITLHVGLVPSQKTCTFIQCTNNKNALYCYLSALTLSLYTLHSILCILFYAFYCYLSALTLRLYTIGDGRFCPPFFKRADNFSSEKHVTCSLDARKNGRRSEIPEAQILARYKNRSCTPAGLLALKLQLKHTGRGERRSNGPEKPQRTQVQCRREMKTTLEMDVSQSVLLPQQLVSSINLR